MPDFQIVSSFKPTGDQPKAIEELVKGIERGDRHQVLKGATGTGKTFTIAHLISTVQKPTLVLAHNKTLAAQLYSEFREIFPQNAVEYFVSYYDYYQPEAYLPRTDTYIEKDAQINDEIERLRNEPVSEQELQKAKTRARAALVRQLDSNSGLAEQLTFYEVLTGDWRNLFQQLERIDRVTAGDIQRVARTYFTTKNRTVGVIETTAGENES